jgi:hypothetical protein
MCPVKILVGRPGIVMSHMCVNFTLLPSGKLIVNGCNEGCKLLTGVPSMINMKVAPVSAIAWFVLIVIALRYCGAESRIIVVPWQPKMDEARRGIYFLGSVG